MNKVKRNERLAVITKILCTNPSRLYTLSYFCSILGATKSSLSEDIAALKEYGPCPIHRRTFIGHFVDV